MFFNKYELNETQVASDTLPKEKKTRTKNNIIKDTSKQKQR